MDNTTRFWITSKVSQRREIEDPKSFFEEATSNLNTEQVQVLQKLYDFSREVADKVDWGSSFQVYFNKISSRKSLYYVYPDGELVFNSHMLRETPEAQRFRDEFKEKLSRIKGMTVPEGYPESSPKYSVAVWSPVVDDFINAVKDLIK